VRIYDNRVRDLERVRNYFSSKPQTNATTVLQAGAWFRVSAKGNEYVQRVTLLCLGSGKPFKLVRESKTGGVSLAKLPSDVYVTPLLKPYYWKEDPQMTDVPYAPPPKYGPEVIGSAAWMKQMDAHKAWLNSTMKKEQQSSDTADAGAGDATPAPEKNLLQEFAKATNIEKDFNDVGEIISDTADTRGKQASSDGKGNSAFNVYCKAKNGENANRYVRVATNVKAASDVNAMEQTKRFLAPSKWTVSEMFAQQQNEAADDLMDAIKQTIEQAKKKQKDQQQSIQERFQQLLDEETKPEPRPIQDDDIQLLRVKAPPLVGEEAEKKIQQSVADMLAQSLKLVHEKLGGDIEALASMVAEIAENSGAPKQAPAVNESAVRQIIAEEFAKLRPQKIQIVDEKDNVVREIKGHTHPLFDKVLRLAKARQPVYLFGPSGSGKTHLAEQIAEALGLEFFALSTTMGTSESQVQGWRLPLGEGKFVYIPAMFVKLYEEGGVFLLDEADRSDPNVLSVLNQALANRRLPIPARFENPVAKQHKDFVIMAAGNTAGTGADRLYTSATRLDEAFLDRFRMGTLRMDYDQALEKSLVGDTEILRTFWQIRAKVAQLRLERVVSTRSILDAHRLGYTTAEAVEALTVTWEPNERQKVGVAA